MDGLRLTDAQVEVLKTSTFIYIDDDEPEFTLSPLVRALSPDAVIQALAAEVQQARTVQAVIATASRDVTARLITPYDALARIVMELASLDSVGTTDGR